MRSISEFYEVNSAVYRWERLIDERLVDEQIQYTLWSYKVLYKVRGFIFISLKKRTFSESEKKCASVNFRTFHIF